MQAPQQPSPLQRIKEVAAEVVTEEELAALVERAGRGERPKAYIGFEPSGTAHVGWMVCTDTVSRLVEAGFDVTILLADWHAQINDKLGGDLAAIRRCGEYMKDAFEALGVPRDRVTYRYAQEFSEDDAYWALVLKVCKATSLARMRRAMTIMGRKEEEADADVSKFFYPAMQVADIFHMGIDLAYGGLDQRHAHMLARDVAKTLGRKPPVALHTPLVPSLKGSGRMEVTFTWTAPDGKQFLADLKQPEPGAKGGGARTIPLRPGESEADAKRRLEEQLLVESKMSKSDPSSGIFLHDRPEEVKAKLKAAHCPAKEVEGNPVLDLLRLVVWPRLAQLHPTGPPRFEIHRPEKFGGNKIYVGYEALLAEWKTGALHPLDLKNGVADALNNLLAPVREYFKRKPENLEFVQGLKRTR